MPRRTRDKAERGANEITVPLIFPTMKLCQPVSDLDPFFERPPLSIKLQSFGVVCFLRSASPRARNCWCKAQRWVFTQLKISNICRRLDSDLNLHTIFNLAAKTGCLQTRHRTWDRRSGHHCFGIGSSHLDTWKPDLFAHLHFSVKRRKHSAKPQ
jgi:hypothetical protein